MPSPKGAVGKMVGGFLVKQAMSIANDPQVRQAVVDGVKPVVNKVKLPQRAESFAQLETALDTVEQLINDQATEGTNAAKVAEWRTTLRSLRTALPLAKADQGKGQRQKLKDLSTRQQALLDDVYSTVVTPGSP